MTTFALLIFFLAYYYFVLRKYNTLGFRLFSLCFFVTVAMLYWWSTDWRELKRVEHHGISTMAEVRQKRMEDSSWLVEVSFREKTGKLVTRSCIGGMSDEELAEVRINQPTSIRYSPESDTFFLEKSFLRQNRDMVWFLVFPAFFLLLGSLSWIFLRRYRIHPHEGTSYEYMTDENGKVVLDDARNQTTKALHNANLFSKIFQMLGRR